MEDKDTETDDAKNLTVDDFCKCNNCIMMESEVENVCCKANKFCVKMPDSICVTEHEDFLTIINKTVLTINLKTIWNSGVIDTDSTDITNKNLRYSAYRSLFIWIRNG